MKRSHFLALGLFPLCGIFAATTFAAAQEQAAPTPAPQTLRIAHLCDPQYGFGGEKGFAGDVARFEQAVRQVNALAPDAVLVAGDLTHNADAKSVAAIRATLAKVRAPLILTPGNHDIVTKVGKTNAVTAESLAAYRAAFGPDFLVREIKGRLIISANSMYWWTKAPKEEVSRHEQLFREALADAKARKLPVILLTHVPPFVKTPTEKFTYQSLPPKVRSKLLELCNDNNVIIWLAGHTHCVSKNKYKNISILNGETTSRNFDQSKYGFRLLTLAGDNSFTWESTPLEPLKPTEKRP
ncbi:MAG: metallophosphoesterase [Puniceicoccales bacterium]|jgi:DNA repair exonuclease SbcCD nuclease subunit|nr:metallophosphoesterase [Puniceicoccales bacterium]